jgi:hypothetical protein
MVFEDFMFPKGNVFVKVGWFKSIHIPKYSILYGNFSVVLQDVFIMFNTEVGEYSRAPSIKSLRKSGKQKIKNAFVYATEYFGSKYGDISVRSSFTNFGIGSPAVPHIVWGA